MTHQNKIVEEKPTEKHICVSTLETCFNTGSRKDFNYELKDVPVQSLCNRPILEHGVGVGWGQDVIQAQKCNGEMTFEFGYIGKVYIVF